MCAGGRAFEERMPPDAWFPRPTAGNTGTWTIARDRSHCRMLMWARRGATRRNDGIAERNAWQRLEVRCGQGRQAALASHVLRQDNHEVTSESPRADWLSTVVFRTVRAIEQDDGPLDDGQAVRSAATEASSPERRLAIRARLLGQRLGLDEAIERWRAWLPWLLLATAAVIGLLSSEILHAVTGQDRRINAIGALAAVLTLPTLSLVVWCVGLLWRRPLAGGGVTRWALAAAARLPGLRTPNSLRLFRAGLEALGQARLVPWSIGLANHVVWIGALLGILFGLLVSFSFRAYTLSWETTILSPAFFARLVSATGALPAALGFPVPDPTAVMTAGGASGDQSPWAWWLIGCTVVYGLFPRLVAMAVCWLVWRRRRATLRLVDPADGYTRTLLDRFARWDAAAAAAGTDLTPLGSSDAVQALPHMVSVIGFELPAEAPWPLRDPPPEEGWTARIEGTAEERRECLDRVAQTRPRQVMIVCWANATPDRGTARFLRAATPGYAKAALLLLGDAPTARWRNWLAAMQLDNAVTVFTDAEQAQAWLGSQAHA
ncbi:MAG TPA: DUF2868 domain-containing protein [Ideonella sp.]|uniref:DUF2868 domain-containing protein n=1 Tax=Ideonella sp. TaxID=1929293 RepID=UPI002E2FD950|nr:DUF2868 domain-containing protein [Ideonella sp.]HEX5688181.1 DUF2868 domain-containing protein [Ideonella sp.]